MLRVWSIQPEDGEMEEVENEKRWENCKSSFRLIRETVGYDV